MKVYYSDDYIAATHDFDTTKKAGRIAARLRADPIPNVQLVEPEPANRDDLLVAHTAEYIDCVLNGGGYPASPRRHRTNGFDWSAGLVQGVLASTGGVIDAVESALEDGLSGSLSSGLHHAHPDSGGGFCTFNGLAVATRLALANEDVASVLILDLDAHYGDGTMAIVGDEPEVTIIDVVTEGGAYGRKGHGEHAVHCVEDGGAYLEIVETLLRDFEPHRTDLVLYNAGMDPHESCRIGGLQGITTDALRQREELVFRWCRRMGVPVAFVLAGGYEGGDLSRDGLDGLHRLTIEAAAAS